MTSKLTRAQLHERARENVKALKLASRQTAFESAREEILADLQLAELALAAMDSEPVAWTWQHLKQWHVTNAEERARDLAWDGVKVEPLYRHAQQPVVSAELLHTAASAIEDLVTTKDRMGVYVCFDLPFRLRSAANAQPAPVAYSDFESFWSSYIHPLAQDDELKDFAWDIWNACRAAILAAAKHDTTALNSVQSVVTVPGKWIPVSEQKPDCWCRTCRPVTLNDMRFVVCPDCGNKRCPRANDHRNACTRSNEPGQEGSAYPAAPQEVRGE